ncbi:hypothetical protein HKCCE2091_04050 [Rhodobacterales bacterium HKCCE2091]|nr:hypothetical protein [Rhodobacterales bacterium HKCCE2091]
MILEGWLPPAIGGVVLLVLVLLLRRAVARRREWTEDDVTEARSRHRRFKENEGNLPSG